MAMDNDFKGNIKNIEDNCVDFLLLVQNQKIPEFEISARKKIKNIINLSKKLECLYNQKLGG